LGGQRKQKQSYLEKGAKRKQEAQKPAVMCIMKSLVHRKSSAKNKEVSPNRQYS
jgi:hypothetical protein